MNPSYLTLLALALGMTYAGCSGDDGAEDGDDDDDDDDGNTDDTPEPTGDTAPAPPEFLEITSYTVDAQFAFDGATVINALDTDGVTEIPNLLIFTLFSDDWTGAADDIDEYCVVQLSLDGATLAEWVSENEGVLYGVDSLEDAASFTDCHDPAAGKVVDTERWGDDITTYWLSGDEGQTWGVGVGEFGEDLLEWIDNYGEDDTSYYQGEEVNWIGGYLKFPFEDDNIFPGMFATGYEIDGANVIVVDEDDNLVPHSYDDAVGSGALPAGLYLMGSVWTFINVTPPY